MKKLEEIVYKIYETSHTITYSIPEADQEKVINFSKLNKPEGFYIIPIDIKKEMTNFDKVFSAIIDFDHGMGLIHDDVEKEYRKLQKVDMATITKEELVEIRNKLWNLETKRSKERPTKVIYLTLRNYISALFYKELVRIYPNLIDGLSLEEEKELNIAFECIKNGDIDRGLDISSLIYEVLDYYEKQDPKIFRVVIQNAQYILDHDFQELINNYMYNVRVRGFRMKVLTSLDSMYHESYEKRGLRNTHDVDRITYK